MENLQIIAPKGTAIEASTKGSKVIVYTTEQIDFLLHEIARDRADKKALEAHESTLKEQLLALVGDATDILDQDGFTDATWGDIKTSRFQTKEFERDYPGLYQAYIKECYDRRLTIKKVW